MHEVSDVWYQLVILSDSSLPPYSDHLAPKVLSVNRSRPEHTRGFNICLVEPIAVNNLKMIDLQLEVKLDYGCCVLAHCVRDQSVVYYVHNQSFK